jgi:hypothetical protein
MTALFGQPCNILPSTTEYRPTRDLDLYDRAYRDLMICCGLSATDRQRLAERKLLPGEIEDGCYRTIDQDVEGNRNFPLERVPGFDRDKDGKWRPTVLGLAVPIKDPLGRVRAIQVRTNEAGGKYRWLSGGPGGSSGSPCHFRGRTWDTILRVTEGAIKANVSWTRTNVTTLGIPGAGLWKSCLPMIRGLRPVIVALAFDMDWMTNSAVRESREQLAWELDNHGIMTFYEDWDPEYKGLDDLLLGSKQVQIWRTPWQRSGSGNGTSS